MKKSNSIYIIIAKKGVGKTTIAYAISQTQPKKVFWITPINDSYHMAKIDTRDYRLLSLGNELQTCFIVEKKRENLDKHLERIINISKNSKEGIFLVIDELDFYVNSHLQHKTKLFEVINYGRHAQLDLLVISRRLQDIPANLATNCDYFILGKNANLENDTKYYKQFFTDNAIQYAKFLEVGEFLQIDTISQELKKLKLSKEVAERLK